MGGKKSKEQRRQSLHLSPVFFENVQMTYCTVMSRLSNVETFAQLKAAHQSQFLSSLGRLLFSKSEAPDTAVCSWRIRREPGFTYRKKCHNALNDAAQRQTAHKTRGQLQFEYGTQGGVLHKELGAFSPFFLCTVHHAEPLGHLVPFWLPHIHCCTAGRKSTTATDTKKKKEKFCSTY